MMRKFTEAQREVAFLTKVSVSNMGCWVWQGGRGGYGLTYGTFFNGSRTVRAHRWAYEHWVGPIPNGLELDHLCRVRLCVNPKHLEPVTHDENSRRSPLKGDRKECKRGHVYSPENIYRLPSGNRECRPCRRGTRRAWDRRRRDAKQTTS
jgi:hypothetical protein